MKLSEFNTGWIIGFIESEGVFTTNTIKIKRKTKFGVKKYQYTNPTFYIVNKDRSALEVVREFLGMGKVNRHGVIFHFSIRRKAETVRFVEFLDGKFKTEIKAQRFWRWKERVLEWKSRVWGKHQTTQAKTTNSLTETAKGF